jgi:hypothetical protein
MPITKRVWLPNLRIYSYFHDRQAMKEGRPDREFLPAAPYPPVHLPVDWTQNNTLAFPIDWNDRYGDCMYAAACHGDNTFTGNNGAEWNFDPDTILQDYLRLSGGDQGLNEGQIVGEWQKGLAGTPSATILGALNLDPTNAAAMQAAIYLFGGVLFTLSVPDAWRELFNVGAVWNAPAVPDPSNGHGVWLNGIDVNGHYKLQTWGTFGWITPAGVAVCDPGAFVVFSRRWFNNRGVAPNRMTFSQLAALWEQFGGQPVTHWKLQQINRGGLTNGPTAVGNPSSFIFGPQAHVLYRDAAGNIWDSYYQGGNPPWNLQQIDPGGVAAGRGAAGDPSSFIFGNQSHVLWRDAAGHIWDYYYDGGNPPWKLQQINLAGETSGPEAAGSPSAFIFSNQSHVLYRDAGGSIWDSYYV